MKFFRDASIRFKVLIPPAVLILALAVVALLAVYGLNLQRAALSAVDEITLDRITLIDEFVVLSEQVQSDVFHIAVLHFMDLPQEEVQPIHARLEQRVNDLGVIYEQILAKWPLDETERSILERMRAPMEDFTQQAQQSADMVSDNPSFGVLLVRSSTVAFTEFRATLAEFRAYQEAEVARIEAASHQQTETTTTAIIAGALVIALAGIIATMRISSRWISRPILYLAHLMRRLAGGDLSAEASSVEREDEIGAMARAVEVFRNNAIERARLDRELRESEERFRELFGSMSSGVAVYEARDEGRDFVLTDLNRAGEEISRVTKGDVVGRSVLTAFPGVREMGLFDVLQQVWRSGEPVHHPIALYEDQRISHWVENYVYKLPSGEVVAVYDDITKRKQAEEEIAGLAKFPSENPHPVLRVAQDSTVMYANSASLPLLNIWGCQEGQPLPTDWQQLTLDVLNSGARQEAEIAVQDGVLSLTFAPVVDEGYVNVYGLDITERKRAEEERQRLLEEVSAGRQQLEALSRRLVKVQETERRQLAYELHEQIAQSLTIVKFVLDQGAPLAAGRVKAYLDEALELLEDLRLLVRDLAFDLRPPMLSSLGLLPALEWLLKRHTEQTKVRVALEHSGTEDRRFAPEVETTAYRVAQAALDNVARHAEVDEAALHVHADDDRLSLEILDQGVGFEPETAFSVSNPRSLAGMREQVSWLGGELTVESASGAGTRVVAEFPLHSR